MAQWHLQAVIPHTLADRAVRVSGQVMGAIFFLCLPPPSIFRVFRPFRAVRVILPTRHTGGDLFQCLVDLAVFAHGVLSLANGVK